MAIWRKPTEAESRIIFEQEKHRITRQRIEVAIAVFSIMAIWVIILVFSNIAEIDKRAEKILGYAPLVTRSPAAGLYVDAEEVEARREKQEKEIDAAKAQAAEEIHLEQLPIYLSTLGLFGLVVLICFFVSQKYLQACMDQKYEVATGNFQDKKFLVLNRHWRLYYVVARFDDGSTEEGKATEQIFEEATASKSVIMVARPNQTKDSKDIRAFLF